MILERIACIIIGYAWGNILTADLVARHQLHASAFDIGTHNPGMANIGHLLGVRWALVVLAGDIGKTAAACVISWLLFAPALGNLAVLYAGCGAVIGHNLPCWHHARGGKGVTVTCVTIVLFDPLIGLISLVLGLIAVYASHYLCVGAIVIPVCFLIGECWVHASPETLALCAFLLLMMILRHGGAVYRAYKGTEPKTNLGVHRS
ncbi:MAG: glycerol-3-phosphate acyltransferase [Eggerthellaceae bacterium]|jgi:glycerol-3-phosphate acyltransferase PlsY|nr:glycerol-3-phosphate acyltransferase [Eggerthellaceae bacterium]MCH4221684.1 glycerol-3-phosphate acyltransferase [Eggerthellaceae bacterium]